MNQIEPNGGQVGSELTWNWPLNWGEIGVESTGNEQMLNVGWNRAKFERTINMETHETNENRGRHDLKTNWWRQQRWIIQSVIESKSVGFIQRTFLAYLSILFTPKIDHKLHKIGPQFNWRLAEIWLPKLDGDSTKIWPKFHGYLTKTWMKLDDYSTKIWSKIG